MVSQQQTDSNPTLHKYTQSIKRTYTYDLCGSLSLLVRYCPNVVHSIICIVYVLQYNADNGSDNVSANVLECNSEQAIVEVIKEKEDVKQQENEKKGERNGYKENSITKEEDVICDVLVNDTEDIPTQQSFTKPISDKKHEEKYNDKQEEKRKERSVTKEKCDVTNERDPINGKVTEETKDTIKFSNTLLFDLD